MDAKEHAVNTIKIKDIDLPSPELYNTNKTAVITEWLINWIEKALKNKRIKNNDLLPSKSELAYFFGVSVGTVQNALRAVEDMGLLVSKQKKGTFISVGGNNSRKLTSKRDFAMTSIKKYMRENNFKEGEALPSSRTLVQLLDIPLNTLRAALQGLAAENIIQKKFKQEYILINSKYDIPDVGFETLVEKIKKDIEQYITDNCKVSDKIPANKELAKRFNAGIKTVNDAISILVKEGVLVTLRGQYGTIVSKMPYEKRFEPLRETSIFAPAAVTAYYYYEKTMHRIKRMINESYYPGSKLPSITELSQILDLSPNTVRRAIKELVKEGILRSMPGRMGGTFVIASPDIQENSYQWIAVSSDFVSSKN